MANTVKKYKITQLQNNDSLLELHPETDADIVKVETGSGKYPGTATNVQAALKETYELASTGGVTGVKGSEESAYRTGNVSISYSNVGAQKAFTDGSAVIASVASDVVTIKGGVKQSAGAILNKTTDEAADIVLAKVAKTGAYSDLKNPPILGTAAACNTGTASGNVPVLDSNGKLNTSIIPSIAITDTFTAANQTAMLALSAQKGDICIRTDINKTFILAEDGASTLSHWKELATPTDAVTSVNGKTGAVTLTYTDVNAASSTHNHNGVYQPVDADLTAIAGLTGNSGLLRKTAANTWSLDTSTYVKESGTSALTISRTVGTNTSELLLGTEVSGSSRKHAILGVRSTTDSVGCNIDVTEANILFTSTDDEGNEVYSFSAKQVAEILDKYTSGTNTLAVNASTAGEFTANKTWALTGDVTGSATTKGGFSMATTLKNSGVTAGTYSAVTVNAKGLVTAGAQMLEVGTTGQTAPSSSLAVGGLFFQEI